ncbi:unnamed protein product, partial [Rotaria sp. Silwood1]
MERMSRHTAQKEKITELQAKYANQIAQLETDGTIRENKRILIHLLEKTDGQVDIVKQRLNERKERRREDRDKHHNEAQGTDETGSTLRKQQKLSVDDIENLKRFRSAGVYGNPMKVLATFHECNESIEMTVARIQQEREQRHQCRDERKLQRNILAEAENGYIKINNRDNWPRDIEQVYLDGNIMMFVVMGGARSV